MKFKPVVILKTRKDLIKALDEDGLPSSTPSLIRFEQSGLISFPRFGLKRGVNGFDRLYTEKEIKEAVVNIANYVKTKSSFGTQ